jgi:apolipoprotein N-acyltransferase
VALQPNVPMTLVKTTAETDELLERHLLLSTNSLQQLPDQNLPRLVIWPESPMNFTYGSDTAFRELVADFTKKNRVSLLFNSLEAAPANGAYNSALLINEEGR